MREQRRVHPLESDGAIANLAAIPARRGGSAGREVDAVMAGFIDWLAERKLPSDQRRRYHLAVERFRCWHTRHRYWHPGPSHDLRRHDIKYGHRRYLAVLRAAGRSHVEVAVVDAALEQLCCYLDRDPSTGSGSGASRPA
jgi:hypothetical protein